VEPDDVEIRVVGCLVEKQRTTPDQYPLTINSLRLACNQSTNRDPVVQYDEGTIRAALERLRRRSWATLASWSTARAVKYKHVLDQTLQLNDAELSLLTVLMLRGPQTVGELKQRSERLHAFPSLEAVETTLDRLAERKLAVRMPRLPGQKEQRYAQLLGGEHGGEEAAARVERPPTQAEPGAADGGLEERVVRLEEAVASLQERLDSLAGERLA
jgi:uncharacterized protein